jgi:hypothetical protein
MAAKRSTEAINTTLHRDERGLLHHETEPAVHWLDGTAVWYIHGNTHREDGPAIEHPSGKHEWYHQGKKHRDNGPAVTHPDGSTENWLHGVRQDPPAAVGDDD